VRSQRAASPRQKAASASSPSPSVSSTAPPTSGASNTASGASSGCSHSAGGMKGRPCRPKQLPKTKPKAVADRPPTISSRATAKRRRSHQPPAASTRPCPTSPNM